MQSNMPIEWFGRRVGTAQLLRQGMYYKIQCHIYEQLTMPCRIELHTAFGVKNLGICCREASGLGLVTRLSVHSVGDKEIRFLVSNGKTESNGLFYAVAESEPFPYLTELKYARFVSEDGKTGIKILKREG